MRPNLLPLLNILLIVLLLSTALPAYPDDLNARYDVVFSDNQSVMTVKACFDGNKPDELTNDRRGASGFIKKAYVVVDERPQSLVVRNGRILTGDLHGRDCMHYQVDFLRVMQTHQELRYMPRKMNHVRTAADAWLWLPPSYRTVDISFHVDKGYRVAAPWRRVYTTPELTQYRLYAGDDNADCLVYFGRMRYDELTVANSALHINIMGDVDQEEADKLVDWLEYGAHALTRAYGRIPVPQFTVMIFPIGPDDSIVPWGEIKREGGNAVHLYVDHTRPLQEIIADWTLIHELSHTLHPFINLEGRWLTEGLATYYQNVLQARAGTLSVEQAWTKLHQGFQRGIAKTESGKMLKQVSRNMRKNHNYMRVYWSGTALWLRADWILRTQYGSSLDNVMAKLGGCCLEVGRTWRPEEFMQKMDDLSETGLFTDMYREYAMSDRFPDVSDVYNALGLIDRDSELAFSVDAPDQALRDSIMRGTPLPAVH